MWTVFTTGWMPLFGTVDARMKTLLLRAIKNLVSVPLALLILFEEWGWEPLQALLARCARWRLWAWIESRIRALPPYAALATFALPSLLLLPVKLLALWSISHGHAVLGASVIIAAKLVGTAVVARLFNLTRPALMQLAWFAKAYGRWTRWKENLLAQVRATWVWRMGRVIKRSFRPVFKRH
jgi:hypothetical protein